MFIVQPCQHYLFCIHCNIFKLKTPLTGLHTFLMRDVLVCWWVQGPLGILIIPWPHDYAVFSPETKNSLEQVTNTYSLSYDTNTSSQHQSTQIVYHFCNSTRPKTLWIFSVLIRDYALLESTQIPMSLVLKEVHSTQSYQQNAMCHKCSSYTVNKRDSAVKYWLQCAK
jgi:hypothetical protein